MQSPTLTFRAPLFASPTKIETAQLLQMVQRFEQAIAGLRFHLQAVVAEDFRIVGLRMDDPYAHIVSHVRWQDVLVADGTIAANLQVSYLPSSDVVSPLSMEAQLYLSARTLAFPRLVLRAPRSRLQASGTFTLLDDPNEQQDWLRLLSGNGEVTLNLVAEELRRYALLCPLGEALSGDVRTAFSFKKEAAFFSFWTEAIHYAQQPLAEATYGYLPYPFSPDEDFYLQTSGITFRVSDIPTNLYTYLPPVVKKMLNKADKVHVVGLVAHSGGSLMVEGKLTMDRMVEAGSLRLCAENFYEPSCTYTGEIMWQQAHVRKGWWPVPVPIEFTTHRGHGTFEGEGYPVVKYASLDLQLPATAYKGKTFTNLSVKAHYMPARLQWEIASKDPSLTVYSEGVYGAEEMLYMHNVFHQVDMRKLQLTTWPMRLSGEATVTLSGAIFSHPLGDIHWQNGWLYTDDKQLKLPDFSLSFHESPVPRRGFSLRGGGARVEVQYRDLKEALTALSQDAKALISPMCVFGAACLQTQKHLDASYTVTAQGQLSALKEIASFYTGAPAISLAETSDYQLSLANDGAGCVEASLSLQADNMEVYGVQSARNQLYFHFIKEKSAPPMWDVWARMEHFSLAHSAIDIGLQEAVFTQQWRGETGHFSLRLTDPILRGSLGGVLLVNDRGARINLHAETLYWKETPWHFSGGVLHGEKHTSEGFVWSVQPLVAQSPQGKITIAGEGNNIDNPITLRVESLAFLTGNFLPIPLPHSFCGSLSGALRLYQKNKAWWADGTWHVPVLHTEKAGTQLSIGAFRSSSHWSQETGAITLHGVVEQSGETSVGVDGSFYPFSPARVLQLDLQLHTLPLRLTRWVVDPFVQSLTGTLRGKIGVKISNMGLQEVSGQLSVTAGQVVFRNIGPSPYTLAGDFVLTEKRVRLHAVTLTDIFDKDIRLHGDVLLNTSPPTLALNATLHEAYVMSLTERERKDLYGAVYANGSLSIQGPLTKPHITGNLEGLPGTSLVISLPHQETLEEEVLVHFKDAAGALTAAVPLKENTTAVSYPFTMDVGCRAEEGIYGEIFLDEAGGGKLAVFLGGDFRLLVDENSNIAMHGSARLTGGYCVFQPHPALRRRLEVLADGTVVWDGDPTKGVANILLSSTQEASVAPLGYGDGGPSYNIRENHLTTVLMHVEGAVSAPAISFAVEIADYPISPQVLFPTKRDKEIQALSLLFFRRFVPIDDAPSLETSSAEQGFSELLSSRVTQWLSTLDEDLSFQIITRDLEARNPNVQLGISYRMLEKRLSIGHQLTPFGGNKPAVSRGTSRFLGDWEVEYLMTKDGRWRVRSYLNSSPQQLLVSGQDTEVGISLRYVRRGDSLFGKLSRAVKGDPAEHVQDDME